jgi:hypothetical protein
MNWLRIIKIINDFLKVTHEKEANNYNFLTKAVKSKKKKKSVRLTLKIFNSLIVE